MCVLQISAQTREQALREVLERLRLPEEALDLEWDEEPADELLAGAKPFVQLRVSIRSQYVQQKIQECLAGVLEAMDIKAQISIETEMGMTLLNVSCEDPTALIGRHGETLDALQHLVVRMTRLSGRDMPLVMIDVANYRKRRIQRLCTVAGDLARLALERDQEEAFDPMEPIDRKIVHTLVKGIDGVQSYSRGEGWGRHVVVAPAD
ncbi:MAG TPA: R3H domain-containing nucleic acid-binding protein [Sumerlaeia bacterium]|nr:R3H domain-containing nucleic acid-binding protein [Sumerlaeia bacterium]